MPARIAASDAERRLAGRIARRRSRHAAPIDHHAFDAEIEDAGALDDQLRRVAAIEQRRRRRDDGEAGWLSSMSMRGLRAARGRHGADEAHAVEDQRVAGEHEEQQHALEDARDLVGDAERDLRRLAAEIGQRQDQAGERRCRAD